MNVFEAVKQSVTTRQAAEHYGIHVGRNGMACCPFHNDKTPSMKLDWRYHCFGCGADGDVIDFAAALYGLGKKEAAVQLAQDFGLSYEDWKPPGKAKKPKPRQKSPEEQFQEAKNRCFRILADYLHLLRAWRKEYAPHSPEEAFHPRFVEAITVVGESGEQVFTVATGFLDADFQSGRGNERGTAPDLYISEQAIEKLSGETKIFRIAFDTIDSSYDKGIMEQLQSITASSPGITILSRYEKQQEMAGYLLTSRIIAAGLSAVFLLIGIMNFINTMVVSVNTRKHEFATLESIGMTKKQIRNVLLWEGGYYWSISFLLLATLGTAIYIPIYSAFRRMVPYAAFHYPVISLLVVAAIVLLVCLATPVITFMQNVKQSVVERLRQN